MFKWKEAYSCNIQEIDKQHKRLFELGAEVNEIISLKDELDHYDEIIKVLNELKDYAVYHFGYEEELMAQYGFKELEEHKTEHAAFVNKISAFFSKDIDADQRKIKMDIIIFIADWIEKHILQTDQKYKVYLNLKGVF